MPISEEEATQIRSDVLSIREDLSNLSLIVRGQADVIRSSGVKLDEIFAQLRTVSPSEGSILREEIDELEQTLQEATTAARRLRNRGQGNGRGN